MARKPKPTLPDDHPMVDHPMFPWLRDEYDPHFDRQSFQRLVLAHITDENHLGRGPRNTTEMIATDLGEDPGDVFDALGELADAGLVTHKDGVYTVTNAGTVELVN